MGSIDYKCVMSLGIRCFTEIFLKNMGYKNFSSPFDAMYLSSVNDIIYLLNNNIQKEYLVHTQDNVLYDNYNKQYGYRTIHTKLDNTLMKKDNIHSLYHMCSFPHHNLKDESVFGHFTRCFQRLDIIEKCKIRTLFCLFMHPRYFGYIPVSSEDIQKLSDYLQSKFNCHLLVVYFVKINSDDNIVNIEKNSNYSTYIVNNNSHEFNDIKHELNEIMCEFVKNKDTLLTYEDIHKVSISE